MFSYIKRITGFISVREQNNIITVEGVPTYSINRDIKRLWQTEKINKNLFIDIDKNSFSFYSFYALDLLYIIDKMSLKEGSYSNSLRTLYKVRSRLYEETWLSKTIADTVPFLNRSKLKDFIYDPLEHQSRFFDFYENTVQKYNLNGMLLAAAAGSGKSIALLMLTKMIDVDATVIVCPKNALINVWEKTLETCYHKHEKFWSSSSGELPKPGFKYYILHYEYLKEFLDNCDFLKSKFISVGLDESHNFNELTSQRTNYFIDLCKKLNSKHTLWLSGTPLKALAVETIPLMRTIDPLFTEEVEYSYRKIYTGSIGKAIEILKNRLGFMSFKVEKKELELLPPVFREIKVKIPNSNKYTIDSVRVAMREFVTERTKYYIDRKPKDIIIFENGLKMYESRISSKEDKLLYEQYRKDLELVIKYNGDWSVKDQVFRCNRFESSKIIPNLDPGYKTQFIDSKSVVKYMGLKIQGEALGRVFGSLRIACHVDMVRHINFIELCESTHKKTLVFTSFVQVLEEAKIYLTEIELNPLVVYAKTTSELTSILTRFREDENINPLVATFKSLSTAVPITVANVVILLDSPFRDHIKDQSISRAHRIGQDSQVYIYTCSLDTGSVMNISTRSFEILSECQKSVEDMMGIKSPYVLTNDNVDEMSIAIEGLNIELEDSIAIKPNFLNW